MDLRGSTIFITGGGSGIGRGLAEDLHARGNKVIISGRRSQNLQEVIEANPGMEALQLDITDPDSIQHAASTLISRHPDLNVLVNNAGIMLADDAGQGLDDEVLTRQLETNFLGPVRLSSALIEHLKQRPKAAIIYTSSILAFAPLAMCAVHSATKAALHSYVVSQRFMLRNTSVSVHELMPNFVATELLGAPDPRAMSLDAFIESAIDALIADVEEVLIETSADCVADRVKRMRRGQYGWVASQYGDAVLAEAVRARPLASLNGR